MFNGPDYNPKLDCNRLKKQLGRVFEVMRDGVWRTLFEINTAIRAQFGNDDPEASISAQLRHLRKPRFGAYTIERRRRGEPGNGLFEYRLAKELCLDQP